MPWNTTFPDGTKSVKANELPGQQNTTYIETTMGNTANDLAYSTSQQDHFWNVGTDYSGHHRFIKSPAYTVGGIATDPGPALGTGIGGILYLKTINNQVQGFFRNSSTIYQYIPAFLTGTVNITSTSTYVTIIPIPQNVYGEIFIWENNTRNIQSGSFMSNSTIVEGFSNTINIKAEGDNGWTELLNGTGAVDLNLKIRRDKGASANYTYRIIYRAI